MIKRKEYTVYEPINIRKYTSEYWYDELTKRVSGYYLFGIIPLYKREVSIQINRNKKSFSKPIKRVL